MLLLLGSARCSKYRARSRRDPIDDQACNRPGTVQLRPPVTRCAVGSGLREVTIELTCSSPNCSRLEVRATRLRSNCALRAGGRSVLHVTGNRRGNTDANSRPLCHHRFGTASSIDRGTASGVRPDYEGERTRRLDMQRTRSPRIWWLGERDDVAAAQASAAHTVKLHRTRIVVFLTSARFADQTGKGENISGK